MVQSQAPIKKNSDSEVIEIMELHPYEMQVIRLIRNSGGFGEITIVLKDGLPFKVKRVMEMTDIQK